jgi:uncharacterized protein
MLFLTICKDKPDNLDLRMSTRPAHLDYLKSLGSKVKVGGALLGPDLKTPGGSMLIYEGETEDEVRSLLAADPYSKAGLFESVTVTAWRQGVGQTLT